MRLQAVSASHYRKRDHKTQSKVNTAASERRRRHNGTNSVSTPPGRKHIKPLEPVAFVILVSAPEPRGLPVSMVSWTVKVPFARRRVCALLNVQVALCANGPRQNAKLRPIIEEMCGEWEELPASTFAAAGRTSAPCCSRQPSHIEEPRTTKSALMGHRESNPCGFSPDPSSLFSKQVLGGPFGPGSPSPVHARGQLQISAHMAGTHGRVAPAGTGTRRPGVRRRR